MDMLPGMMSQTVQKESGHLHWRCHICCFMEHLDKKELIKLRNGLRHPLWAWVHETNLQCRVKQWPVWSARIQRESAGPKAGPAGRVAGKPRKASWSGSRVGGEAWLWGRGNARSGHSAPESCPVDKTEPHLRHAAVSDSRERQQLKRDSLE